jgi:hypothetical protein
MRASDPDKIAEVARSVGVEADMQEARKWMVAVSAADRGGDRTAVNDQVGVFGDRVSLLDFDPDDLDNFRSMVPRVRLESDSRIETAIAIAGSAAQGKIQLFPGDNDFFERVHIHADSRQQAEGIFRSAFRTTALRAATEPDIVLLDANLGIYREPVVRQGKLLRPGYKIEWTTPELLAGRVDVELPDGSSRAFAWDDTPVEGFLYLYWIVADRQRQRIAIASNIFDVSWEGPDGVIHSFDGSIDPLIQEIYLEPGALPLVERLQRLVRPGAREAYQRAMREEVHYYLGDEVSYGKVAKRLYNLFRVTDELEAAAYVRELFDEPSAGLYQVSGLLEAADAAFYPDSGIDREVVLRQLDVLAVTLADATSGEDEARLLASVGQLRVAVLGADTAADQWATSLARVRSEAAALVNEFFRLRLLAHPAVSQTLLTLQKP